MDRRTTPPLVWATSGIALICGIAALWMWSDGNIPVAIIMGGVAILTGFTASRIDATSSAGASCLECRRPIADDTLFCSPEHDEAYNASSAW